MEENILNFYNSPVVILEGGLGLPDTERDCKLYLQDRDIDLFVLDDLYNKPERILAIQYLKPKLIIFGSTCTYEDELKNVIELYKTINYVPDIVAITHGKDESTIIKLIKQAKEIKPELQAYSAISFGKDDIIFKPLNIII